MPTAHPSHAGSSDLPSRRAIAGLAGFQSSSRIVFAEEPDKVHELSATYLFPERVRLRLSLAQEKTVDRVMLYRAGARGFSIDQRVATSREITGEELAELVLETELRRALFLWPDGFAWGGDARERSVDLGAQGRLVAQLGDDGRPTTMHSFDGAGNPAETLADIAWKKKGARYFPAHLTLSAGAERIWSEDVVEVETALDYVDAFFLPPDRRAQDPTPRSDPSEQPIDSIDIPARWEVRVPLATSPATSVSSARAAAEAARSSWRERGITALEGTILELDRQGRPTACLLRSLDAGNPPAEGWMPRAECPAWSLLLTEATVDARAIESIAARIAIDDKTASFQLSFAKSEHGSETARLVVMQQPR